MPMINLLHLAQVIGRCVDQISSTDPFHSRRVATMAWRIGRRLGLAPADAEDLLMAALIHDCGVDSPAELQTIGSTLVWPEQDRHCLRGGEYISTCNLLRHLSPLVRHHHRPWRDLPQDELDERQRLLTNILFTADRCYVGYALAQRTYGHEGVINHKDDILAFLGQLGADAIAPDIRQAFTEVARTDGFWLSLHPDYLDNLLSPLSRVLGTEREVSLSQMRNVATLLARLVDAKSHFTQDHSHRVSLIATGLAERLGLDREACQEMEIAGLLHDIGKQLAPDSILGKVGALTAPERAIIKRHTIDSEVTLTLLFPNSRIVGWAASHHEKLDGSGYPYGLAAADLCLGARALTVADIFQALTQERPYRGRMSCDDAIAVVGGMVQKGELDHEAFAALSTEKQHFFELSTM